MGFKILLMDDEPLYKDLIEEVLSPHEMVLNYVSNPKELKNSCEKFKPDLILLDWNMGPVSGIDVLHQIRMCTKMSKTPVIMLTGNAHENEMVTGLNEGADDYITKPFKPSELVARIKANIRKYQLKEDHQLLVKDFILDEYTLEVTFKGKTCRFQKKPFYIFKSLLENPKKVFSHKEINQITSDSPVHIGRRTADTYVANIRKELGHAQIIQTVWGKGYKINVEYLKSLKF